MHYTRMRREEGTWEQGSGRLWETGEESVECGLFKVAGTGRNTISIPESLGFFTSGRSAEI